MRQVIFILALAACGNDHALEGAGPDAGTTDPGPTDAATDGASGEPVTDAGESDAPPSDAGVPAVTPLAVVVGYGGRRARSLDGVTWTNFTQIDPDGGDDNNLLRGVGYGNGTFIAVGGSSSGFVTTSTDGVTWSAPNRSLGSWLGGVAAIGTKFVAAGGNGLRVRSLDNGKTWTNPAGYQSVHYRDLASNGTIAVAVGHDTSTHAGVIATTTDGVTWTERKRGGTEINRIVYGNGVFVAGGHTGRIHRSTNGTTWTETTPLASGTIHLAFNGTHFVAWVNGNAKRSTDGLTWTSAGGSTRPVDGFINGRYLGLTWPAAVHSAQSLSSWSQAFAPGGSGFTRIAIGEAP